MSFHQESALLLLSCSQLVQNGTIMALLGPHTLVYFSKTHNFVRLPPDRICLFCLAA